MVTTEDSVILSPAKCDKGGAKKRKRYVICNPIDTSELWKDGELLVLDLHVNEESFSEYTDKDVLEPIQTFDIVIGEELHCRTCFATFTNLDEFRLHYQDDWHRFNIKAKLRGRTPISQEEFCSIEDGISSISGSESEEEIVSKTQTGNPKIVFQNGKGQQMSIYRCLMYQKKKPVADDFDLLQAIYKLPFQNQWAVIMLGGGHFAAAIFKGPDLLCHKTFHSYTVRAKQGGSQSSKDNKSGGSHPKSAGAALRRYNEAAFTEHVHSILTSWTDELNRCNLIFCRAASSNHTILFGGKTAVFDKTDPRLRSIPFPTRRATLKEVKRVWLGLATIDIRDPDDIIADEPAIVHVAEELANQEYSDDEIPLNIRLPARYRKKNTKADDDNDVPDDEELGLFPGEKEIMETLRETVSRGNVNGFQKEMEKLAEILNVYHEEFHLELADVLNQRTGQECNTLLHIAALSRRATIVCNLLELGCDPSLNDTFGRVPYVVASDKETRSTFRRFMGANPDRYDYIKAQIPSPLTEDIQKQKLEKLAEKRKQQRQAKKERQALERAKLEQEKLKIEEQKKEEEEQRKVQEEKQRFLQLSDREKRALAAERRFLTNLSASGLAAPVLARCFLCGIDMSGKVPFEYTTFKFCTPTCLQKHRKLNIKS